MTVHITCSRSLASVVVYLIIAPEGCRDGEEFFLLCLIDLPRPAAVDFPPIYPFRVDSSGGVESDLLCWNWAEIPKLPSVPFALSLQRPTVSRAGPSTPSHEFAGPPRFR